MKKNTQEIIDQLSLHDAIAVLTALADSDAQLSERIAEIATEQLMGIDPDDVAAEVFQELDFLEVKDVWNQAGASRDGYRDTDEVADEMIINALAPHTEELSRYQRLDMQEEATYICMGIISGLYLFECESSSEFKDWAGDLPVSHAEGTLRKWCTKDVQRELVDEMESFIQSELPNWPNFQRSLKKPPATER